MPELLLALNFEWYIFLDFNLTKLHLYVEYDCKKLLCCLFQYFLVILEQKYFFSVCKQLLVIKKLSSGFLEKYWILYKNDTIQRKEIWESRIFHDFLSVRMSHYYMGTILCMNCLRIVSFLIFMILTITAHNLPGTKSPHTQNLPAQNLPAQNLPSTKSSQVNKHPKCSRHKMFPVQNLTK